MLKFATLNCDVIVQVVVSSCVEPEAFLLQLFRNVWLD
jgi:hypothetical protein